MSRSLSIALALAVAVALQWPAAARQATATLSVPFTTFTLPNGLTVILHEDHSVPKIAVNVWYHVGS